MSEETKGHFQRVAALDELEPDRACARVVDGVDIVLIRRGDSVRVFENRCPHQGTLLSEGEIAGDELVCRGHGWRFALASGERRGGPARVCLRAHSAEVSGSDVLVRIEAQQAHETQPQAATRRLEELPGPRGWPIFGNALQLEPARLHENLERWASEYGPLYRVQFMNQAVLVVTDPEIAETLLRARPQSLRRMGPIEPAFAEIGAAGVFSAEGGAWRAQRRLAMQALSNRNLRSFFPTLLRVAERLRVRWTEFAASGGVLDVQDDLMRFTVDVTTSLVFSTDMNTLGGGEEVLQRHLSQIFPALTRRLLSPFPYWRYFKLPADRALDRALAQIRRIQDGLVSDARARLEQQSDADREPRDFLEAMLLARDEDGEPFPDETIHGNMLTMLVAGEDTTAHSLAWVVHYLCDRPDVVTRMRVEVDAACAGKSIPERFEDAQSLPYVDAVASEAMRLKPVVPFLSLEANEELVVGDVLVPAGTWVDVLLRLPQLEAKHFSDPLAFRPERWLPEQKPQAHAGSVSIPFGSGPRICPGRSLALLEMRLVLAMLVRSFEIERAGSAEDIREHFAFTMSPNGLRVRLRPRAVGLRAPEPLRNQPSPASVETE